MKKVKGEIKKGINNGKREGNKKTGSIDGQKKGRNK
jgi:hypothetical protein